MELLSALFCVQKKTTTHFVDGKALYLPDTMILLYPSRGQALYLADTMTSWTVRCIWAVDISLGPWDN